MEKIKSCWNCKNSVHFIQFDGNHVLFCMMAQQYLPQFLAKNNYIVECDYYRDDLHDHYAMDRAKQENDQSLPNKE